MNMLAVWWIGRPLEDALGPVRYLLLYLVSGLAGSAGALIANPTAVRSAPRARSSASSARRSCSSASAPTCSAAARSRCSSLNLAFTFAVPGISIGGHLGGLAGGALAILAMSHFGRRSAVYARDDLSSYASLVAIGLVSIAIAYWKVRGYA